MSTTQGQADSSIVTATCPAGTHLLGGGATAGSQEAHIVYSAPGYSGSGQPNDTWAAFFNVTALDALGDMFTINAFAFCGDISS